MHTLVEVQLYQFLHQYSAPWYISRRKKSARWPSDVTNFQKSERLTGMLFLPSFAFNFVPCIIKKYSSEIDLHLSSQPWSISCRETSDRCPVMWRWIVRTGIDWQACYFFLLFVLVLGHELYKKYSFQINLHQYVFSCDIKWFLVGRGAGDDPVITWCWFVRTGKDGQVRYFYLLLVLILCHQLSWRGSVMDF